MADASSPAPRSATVAVVVVTYNSTDHIGSCLDSVVGQLPADSTVIVVDNASSDGSADLIERGWPQVDLRRSDRNVGFAAACNLGARGLNTDFVLLINPDAVMHDGCIEALCDLARRFPGGGLYGGRMVRPDGEVDRSSCFGRPTLWSLFCFAVGLSSAFASVAALNPEGLGSWSRDSERDVYAISGGQLLVAREVWEQLGGFDEQFFMYGEDIDLARRAHALGCAPMITPRAVVTHVGGASSPNVSMEILLYRGKVSLVRSFWSGWRRALALTFLMGGVWMRGRSAGLISRVRRGPASRTSPSTWHALWRRRDEWRDGWPSPEA